MPFVPNTGVIDFKFTIDPEGIDVEFPTYINSIAARFNPNWEEYREVGRADPKYLYNSYSKIVEIDFRVVAESDSRDTTKVFDDLEKISKAAAPRYTGGGYQGSFLIFTVGKIYVKQVGILTGMQYEWDNTQITWDLKTQLPVLTSVSMTIAWIGRQMPQSRQSVRIFR